MSDKQRAQISATKRSESPYKNLLKELDAHQLSYIALSKLLGLSVGSVSMKMLGTVTFTSKDVAKLVALFNKPIEYLLQRDDEDYPNIFEDYRNRSLFKNLIAEMNARKLTYEALSKLLGLSTGSVSMKMRGKVRFTDRDKKKLVEIFDKPIEYLLQRYD